MNASVAILLHFAGVAVGLVVLTCVFLSLLTDKNSKTNIFVGMIVAFVFLIPAVAAVVTVAVYPVAIYVALDYLYGQALVTRVSLWIAASIITLSSFKALRKKRNGSTITEAIYLGLADGTGNAVYFILGIGLFCLAAYNSSVYWLG